MMSLHNYTSVAEQAGVEDFPPSLLLHGSGSNDGLCANRVQHGHEVRELPQRADFARAVVESEPRGYGQDIAGSPSISAPFEPNRNRCRAALPTRAGGGW
jgi:hypothetical protein